MTPEDIGEFGRRLALKQTEDRMRVVKQLARIADLDAQRLLVAVLKDRSSYVATLAAETLAECAEAPLLPALLAHFEYLSVDGPKRDPGCHVRSKLAYAFGRLEVMSAVDALRVGIRTRQMEGGGGGSLPADTAIPLRANCALALAQLRDPLALRDISILLFDEGDAYFTAASNVLYVTVEARKAAAQALGRLGNPAGVVALAIKLAYPGSEVPEVLQECMQAVVDLEDDYALELLEPYLSHRDQHLIAFAALMIARTREPQALALIVKTLDRLTGDPLQAGILAISTIRTEEAQAMLKQLATSDRKDIKRIVAEMGIEP